MSKKRISKTSSDEAPKLKSADPHVVELWIRAGGRCEFQGCNDYLLQDKLTTNKAKLADIAHIAARSAKGPRGDGLMPISKRNGIENLFLACMKHHRMIDNKSLVSKFPKELLLQYKQVHEERIRYLTGLSDERETTIVRLIGNIRGTTVSISNEEIRDAVLKSSNRYPRYLGGEQHIEINLTNILEEDIVGYWKSGTGLIKDAVECLLYPAIQKGSLKHLSVFAFARIPFLAYLGYVLGDKIPVEIYQKQRTASESWVWSNNKRIKQFTYTKIQLCQDSSSVVVILSLSGKISIGELPKNVSVDSTIYSLEPKGTKPGRMLISSKKSLEQFRQVYAALLREIEANYPNLKAIQIIPAVPISAALILGRELLKNVSPSLIIYDKEKTQFEKAIEINTYRRAV